MYCLFSVLQNSLRQVNVKERAALNGGEKARKSLISNKTKQNPTNIHAQNTHTYTHNEKPILGRKYTRMMTVVISEK